MYKCSYVALLMFFLMSNCSHEEKHTPNPYEDDIPTEPKVHIVEIRQMKFNPAELKVHRGDKVVWVNHDILVHDITEEKSKAWTSAALPVGSSWGMVFTKSSTYYCSIHVVMKGTVIVE